MLSSTGWLDGITASGVVIFGIIFGLYFISHSKKVEAKLLYYVGLLVILAGLAFLGVFLDFLNVVITGKNLDNSYGMIGLLSYVWIAPLIVVGIYLGAELMIPKRKGLLTGIYLVLMGIFEILLFIDPFGSFDFLCP